MISFREAIAIEVINLGLLNEKEVVELYKELKGFDKEVSFYLGGIETGERGEFSSRWAVMDEGGKEYNGIISSKETNGVENFVAVYERLCKTMRLKYNLDKVLEKPRLYLYQKENGMLCSEHGGIRNMDIKRVLESFAFESQRDNGRSEMPFLEVLSKEGKLSLDQERYICNKKIKGLTNEMKIMMLTMLGSENAANKVIDSIPDPISDLTEGSYVNSIKVNEGKQFEEIRDLENEHADSLYVVYDQKTKNVMCSVKDYGQAYDVLNKKQETLYIEFLNKDKNYQKDRVEFVGINRDEDALVWGRKNLDNFNSDMIKSDRLDDLNSGKISTKDYLGK